MQQETKTCQNCKQDFTIDPEDLQFYERMQVPPPTFCPQCRLQRRYAWRNERSLFKATCGNCKKDIFSAYAPDSPFPVYCHDCWFSDAWDPFSYGKEYDFSRPFFEQFKEMFDRVPRVSLFQVNAINSPYSNIVREVKNTYLSYSIVEAEDVFYSKNTDHSRYIFDSLDVNASERCYWNIYGEKNYDVSVSVLSRGSISSMFLHDCANVSNSFMAVNLRNRENVIRNRQYSKEDYRREMEKIDTGSYEVLQKLLAEFDTMRLKYPRKYASITKAVNSTGDILTNVKNTRDSFDVYDMEDVRHTARCFGLKDSMDTNNTGMGSELIYEYISGGKMDRNLKYCVASFGGLRDTSYSGWCGSSSDLFGCFGIRNKKFCILNKEYAEEEYRTLIPQIIEHMNAMPYEGKNSRVYRYGEFWPIELSPFAYNESTTQEVFTLNKAEVEKKGYRWRDFAAKNPAIDIAPRDLPDHIKEVGDDITQKTIGCLHGGECNHQCTRAFRVVQAELEMYRRVKLPLPRLCPNCRHYARLAWRNPWRLWHRTCQCVGAKSSNGVYANTAQHFHGAALCPSAFETPYAPDRPEIVYCEACYNSEVV